MSEGNNGADLPSNKAHLSVSVSGDIRPICAVIANGITIEAFVVVHEMGGITMIRVASIALAAAIGLTMAAQAQPLKLNPTQLDRVTAGAQPFSAVSNAVSLGNGAFTTSNGGNAVTNGTVRFWKDGTINNYNSQAYLHANSNSVVGTGCAGTCTRIRNPNDM